LRLALLATGDGRSEEKSPQARLCWREQIRGGQGKGKVERREPPARDSRSGKRRSANANANANGNTKPTPLLLLPT